jgi:pectate lyase
MKRHLLLGLLFLPATLAAGTPAAGFLKKPDAWFRSAEGRKTTDCVLSWQAPSGSWPKNTDTARKEFSGDRNEIKGTFDNGATTDELRFLARAFRATGDQRGQAAVLRGLDHILDAQYANGGFPQYHPPGSGYHRHITFNDGSMVRLLEFLREVASSDTLDFVDQNRREAARKSFDRGIACILQCQVIVRGTPTVWCAQHDEVTLEPAPARSYELRSLSIDEAPHSFRPHVGAHASAVVKSFRFD